MSTESIDSALKRKPTIYLPQRLGTSRRRHDSHESDENNNRFKILSKKNSTCHRDGHSPTSAHNDTTIALTGKNTEKSLKTLDYPMSDGNTETSAEQPHRQLSTVSSLEASSTPIEIDGMWINKIPIVNALTAEVKRPFSSATKSSRMLSPRIVSNSTHEGENPRRKTDYTIRVNYETLSNRFDDESETYRRQLFESFVKEIPQLAEVKPTNSVVINRLRTFIGIPYPFIEQEFKVDPFRRVLVDTFFEIQRYGLQCRSPFHKEFRRKFRNNPKQESENHPLNAVTSDYLSYPGSSLCSRSCVSRWLTHIMPNPRSHDFFLYQLPKAFETSCAHTKSIQLSNHKEKSTCYNSGSSTMITQSSYYPSSRTDSDSQVTDLQSQTIILEEEEEEEEEQKEKRHQSCKQESINTVLSSDNSEQPGALTNQQNYLQSSKEKLMLLPPVMYPLRSIKSSRYAAKLYGQGSFFNPSVYNVTVNSHISAIESRLVLLQCKSLLSWEPNILFHAASINLYRTQEYHYWVRHRVVMHMKKCRRTYRTFFPNDFLFAKYLNEMGRPNTCGDLLTLRAVADCFVCSLHIVKSDADLRYITYNPRNTKNETVASKRPLFFLYCPPLYYNAFAPLYNFT